MTAINLDRGLLDLAARAGYVFRTRDDGAVLLDADMETVFEITHADGVYLLHRIQRGDRGTPEVSSSDLTHIEKYLTWTFAGQLRRSARLAPLTPTPELELPIGFSLTPRPEHGHTLRWDDERGPQTMYFSLDWSAISFAHYVHADRADIEASMLAPDGGDLFSLRSGEGPGGAGGTPWYRRGRAT